MGLVQETIFACLYFSQQLVDTHAMHVQWQPFGRCRSSTCARLQSTEGVTSYNARSLRTWLARSSGHVDGVLGDGKSSIARSRGHPEQRRRPACRSHELQRSLGNARPRSPHLSGNGRPSSQTGSVRDYTLADPRSPMTARIGHLRWKVDNGDHGLWPSQRAR